MPECTTRLALTPEELAAVRDLLARHKEADACALLGVTRHALPRILAGLDVRAGNIALVRQGLARVSARNSSPPPSPLAKAC